VDELRTRLTALDKDRPEDAVPVYSTLAVWAFGGAPIGDSLGTAIMSYLDGGELDPAALYPGLAPRVVALLPYEFEQHRC
jgi:hypothetical protein